MFPAGLPPKRCLRGAFPHQFDKFGTHGGRAIGPFHFVPRNGTVSFLVGPKPSGLVLYSSRKWFEASLKKAAIDNFTWHDLRHSFGSRLRSNGIPIEDIGALMGHNLGRNTITARYAHADIDRLRAAVDSLVTKTGTNTGTPTVVEFPVASTA